MRELSDITAVAFDPIGRSGEGFKRQSCAFECLLFGRIRFSRFSLVRLTGGRPSAIEEKMIAGEMMKI